MSDRSQIEWTDGTWNPVRGCTKISPGSLAGGRRHGLCTTKAACTFDPRAAQIILAGH